MSQVIERIRNSCELLVDRWNYCVRSNSADQLVIPLKYNLFSEFEGNSLVNWMNMYLIEHGIKNCSINYKFFFLFVIKK